MFDTLVGDYLCIYHGGCSDGFAAAYTLWKHCMTPGYSYYHYPYKWEAPKIEFYPGIYQKDPPDCKNKIVFMLDFSYKRPIMEKIIGQSEKFIWFDHHVSAIEDMKSFPWREQDIVVTDVNRSGAGITADYFSLRTPFINYIEDRDLWKMSLPNTLEFSLAERSYPQDFEIWDRFSVDKLIEEGKVIKRYYDLRCNEIIKTATTRNIKSHSVPVANGIYHFASDVSNILAENKPFAATWYFDGTRYNFSLRSKDNGIDVSDIAKQFGGGGHKHAAGFAVSDLKEVFS